MSAGIEALAEGVLNGDRFSAAKALNCIVDERPGYEELWRRLYPHSGTAHRIGLFGPPGSGKSTLTGALVKALRAKGEKVGVLAVDPSSPYTGGAFLGDRLRFQEHALDPGVFIRSLASRGMVGGLSAGVFGALRVLEAYGCGVLLLETVGTGQDEVDIAKAVDTVLYVSTPSLGDEIQGLKAGSMEIGDVFAINKCDLEGKDKAIADMRRALAIGREGSREGWAPPVVGASALNGEGLEELLERLDAHRRSLGEGGEGRRRRRAQALEELSVFLTQRLTRDLRESITEPDLDRLVEKKTDPVALGRELLAGLQTGANR